MVKLDEFKIRWIINQKRKVLLSNREIASQYDIFVHWIQKLWARYTDQIRSYLISPVDGKTRLRPSWQKRAFCHDMGTSHKRSRRGNHTGTDQRKDRNTHTTQHHTPCVKEDGSC